MYRRKELTILSLLEPNLMVRRISNPGPERWFLRRKTKLSDWLLANAVEWPRDLKGLIRQDLSHRSLRGGAATVSEADDL